MTNPIRCKGWRNNCQKILTRKKDGLRCSACTHKRNREKDPVKYLYHLQKSNAKKRKPKHFPDGIPFLITLEEWRWFWEVRYPWALKKKIKDLKRRRVSHKNKISVDRKDDRIGYTLANIQLMSVRDNSRKVGKVWVVDVSKTPIKLSALTVKINEHLYEVSI